MSPSCSGVDIQSGGLKAGTSHIKKVDELARVFNDCFEFAQNTVLVCGADEPMYLPSGAIEQGFLEEPSENHCIFSTKDYPASALHEISHWCLAGEKRRLLVDYGYWYEPDGRSEEKQRLFEQVEVKPQALERIFAKASRVAFRLSVDNVNNPNASVSVAFRDAVQRQTQNYLIHGLPDRAQVFCHALMRYFDVSPDVLSTNAYPISDLA
jgi:elongation factor P hydroxylase